LIIYNELKKQDKNPTFAFVPMLNHKYNLSNLNGIFPISGIANRLTIHCKEQLNYSIYKSDRFGFNNPDKVWDDNNIDILLIGDSFVHGSCVNEKDTISGKIRDISNMNVINLGMGGSGPLIELASLKEYGIKKNLKKFFGFIMKEMIYR